MTDAPFAPSFDPPASQPPRPVHHHYDLVGGGTGLIYPDVVRPEGWTPGDPLPAAEPYPGFHANTTADWLAEHPEIKPFVVTPRRLRQAWSEGETVALRFADRAEFLAIAGADAVEPERVVMEPIALD